MTTGTATDPLSELSQQRSGIGFIHRHLGRAARRWGLEDLILVLDDPVLGRQVFRRDRRPIDDAWSRRVAAFAAPGLHARPADGDLKGAGVLVQLCAVALRLDVLGYRSMVDPLTHLFNRAAFDELLRQSCGRASRYRETVSLVVLDLDGLKQINDTRGHAAGDAVLQQVGRSILRLLRGADAAARLGGDEFALILPETDQAGTDVVVDRLRADVTYASRLPVGVSAGWAVAPMESADPEALYEVADRRMYEDKRRRRGRNGSPR